MDQNCDRQQTGNLQPKKYLSVGVILWSPYDHVCYVLHSAVSKWFLSVAIKCVTVIELMSVTWTSLIGSDMVTNGRLG